VILRPATPGDAVALAEIYGRHVLHGLGTFEEEPPAPTEMALRLDAVVSRGLPYLVAETDRVIGFAYAMPFRLRAAYRYTAEDSIYVAAGHAGQGVGKALLAAVIDRCSQMGLRQLVAVIGDSGNAASIGLHRALGFELNGVVTGVGFKHGRWVDIVMMQKTLEGGATSPPDSPGLALRGA
jgi:phosphinothricin acetyltransferase